MERRLAWFAVVALLAVTGALILYSALENRRSPAAVSTDSRSERVRVVATFYPLAALAAAVAGDVADVRTVVEGSVEPHDYEPTPRDILSVREADIVVYGGAGIDAWAEKIRPELESSGTRVIAMESFADPIRVASQDSDEGDHPHDAIDPHFWLDPAVAERFVSAIRDALIAEYPVGADEFARNADAAIRRLRAIDEAYRTRLSDCAKRDIIVSHDAFSYLERRYGFTAHSITGLSPEEEPTPRRIAELVEFAKTHEVRYVFFETLVSPRVAETLAGEIGVSTLVFDPIEGLSPSDAAAGRDYFSIMLDNLENLGRALECR